MERIDITTPDGVCPAWVFEPAGASARTRPAVILYMDGPGIRPALHAMAQRLADHGYFVLLPDLFYRVGGADPVEQKLIFTDPEKRQAWFTKYLPAASLANVSRDTPAFLAYLASEPRVEQAHVGVVGYCMGGGHALTAAGEHPDRIVAAAAYHPAMLVTDAADSPHRLAPRMRARVYVAAAANDALFSDEMQARLAEALASAGVEHRVETYEGTIHGFVPSDTPVHDPVAAERHWDALFGLLDATLPPRR